MSTSWTDTCLCNCSFSVVTRSRASLQVLKSTSTPDNCVSTFVLFVRKRFTSCTSSSALWIIISELWYAVSQYSTFNACANLRTKSYENGYRISKKRFERLQQKQKNWYDLSARNKWRYRQRVKKRDRTHIETYGTCRFRRARSFNWISSDILCSNCRIFLSYSLTFSSWYFTSRCRPCIVISFLPWDA